MAKWIFDTSHSGIAFSVRHLMISKVRGSFGKWSGTFEYDEADPTRTKLEVHIDASSIDTREEKRDAPSARLMFSPFITRIVTTPTT